VVFSLRVNELILDLLGPLNNFLMSSPSYFLSWGTPSRAQQALLAKLSGSRILLKPGACSPLKLEGSGPEGSGSTQLPPGSHLQSQSQAAVF
jgi:hypothetical protein